VWYISKCSVYSIVCTSGRLTDITGTYIQEMVSNKLKQLLTQPIS
jgi:hypothetical protein